MSKKSRFKRWLRRQETPEEAEPAETKPEIHEIKHKNPLMEIYDKHYKKLLIIPFSILIIAFIIIGMQYFQTGDFFNKAIDIKGGISITIPTEKIVNADELQNILSPNFKKNEIDIRTLSVAGRQTGIIVDIDIDLNDEANIEKLISLLRKELDLTLQQGEYTITGIGSSLGKSFFRETLVAVLISFLAMSLVVFLYFRIPIPCLAIVLCSFSNIVITLAVVNLIGMRISTAGIAAFLMLIGYSVDTDILLTTRLLKRKEGTEMER